MIGYVRKSGGNLDIYNEHGQPNGSGIWAGSESLVGWNHEVFVTVSGRTATLYNEQGGRVGSIFVDDNARIEAVNGSGILVREGNTVWIHRRERRAP